MHRPSRAEKRVGGGKLGIHGRPGAAKVNGRTLIRTTEGTMKDNDIDFGNDSSIEAYLLYNTVCNYEYGTVISHLTE